ncbi:hypothetical protein LZP85_11700 [Priestia flexa]|jgi:hypothetical protein|uniref:Uncharacterized protein n=1 Tax=Priestia flexa TaxID=86664 RepID=A0A1N6QXB4_9BACI|nr:MULTISPECIES: hypothetical protein [Priestia]MBN8251880.1 hypothetical protein [Priestia flexa]MBN8435380.1 hypothetical protein [Priestia flexa]MBY6085435.1 hypothetical protein [Priestia flexa]MCA0968043.1 hypothetical protein [Priestia flexa]MCA1203972.1 hypothetical protein [Priestia flexa]
MLANHDNQQPMSRSERRKQAQPKKKTQTFQNRLLNGLILIVSIWILYLLVKILFLVQ